MLPTDSSTGEPAPIKAGSLTRTFEWTFPWGAAVTRPLQFAVQRETNAPETTRFSLSSKDDPELVASLEVAGRTVTTFEVSLAASETQPEAGIIRAQLSILVSSRDAPEPAEVHVQAGPAPATGGLELAAEIWAQCYTTSDRAMKGALRRVLGAPVFDGVVALRLVQRADLYAAEIAWQALDAFDKDEASKTKEARDRLTVALLGAMDEIRGVLWSHGPFVPTALEEGIPSWTARLAAYVERLGEKEIAEKARARGRQDAADGKLWSFWMPTEDRPPLFALSAAAFALWRSKVLPQLVRERTKPPALAMAIHEPVVSLLSRTHRPSERDGQKQILLADDQVVKVSTVEAGALAAIFVDRGIRLFGSVTAHRLFRWEIFTAHDQALAGHPDPRVLVVDGGYSALAELLKMTASKSIEEVRDIIEAQHACEIPLPPRGDYSRLLIRRVLSAVGGRRGKLELVLGTALLPNYVKELQQAFGPSRLRARATRLVPVLDLPPFVGRNNEHGQQATLSMLVVAHLRDHARDLIEEGGVRLDAETMATLALRAAVPHGTMPQLLDRWGQDGPDGPAFLKRTEGERFTLGDTHAAARTFLEEGAKRELAGITAGQKSVAKKVGKLKRLGRRKLDLFGYPTLTGGAPLL